MSKYFPLWLFIKDKNLDNLTLTFDEIKEILKFDIDHSFLKYKKELLDYWYEVKKIKMKENKKLISEIIKDVKHDMNDEDILSLLASSKVSENTSKEVKNKYSFGQKAADKIAKFAGSWGFIFSFVFILQLWMITNILLAAKAFDPYPFNLLNLVLSCVAAIQAPLIMMSQNRQEEKDRKRAENDYKVNLKTEIMIEDLHKKLTKILARQDIILKYIEEEKNKDE